MRRVLLAATLAALLVPAAPAAASTLTFTNGVLTFTGSGAAANNLTLSGTNRRVFLVINDADTVAGNTAPGGCQSPGDGRTYSCGPVSAVVLNLGAGDDVVTV